MLLLILALLTQAPAVETRTVWVTATGEDGAAVTGLEPHEVALIENGVARMVTRLEHDARPLTAIVLLDSSLPMASVFRLHLVDAVAAFLGALPAAARVSVWTTGDRPAPATAFVTGPAAAAAALKRTIPQGGNTVLDAVVEAAESIRVQEGDRAAVVVVTGSGIGFSSRDRRAAAERAQVPGVEFHAVQFDEAGSRDVAGAGPDQVGRADYDYVLERLTSGTGGAYERLVTAMAASHALRKVAGAVGGRYRLSYETSVALDARRIEVQVARPGVAARVWAGPR